MTSRVRGERGFALVAAMWLLVALSIVGLELAREGRARRLAAANVLEASQARAAARAGLEHVRSRLAWRAARAEQGAFGSARAVLDPWAGLDSMPFEPVALGAARYAVRIRDVGTALHLNRASEDEVRRLFVALRVDAGEADRLAQAILDWRDSDDLHRARGAEREAYERAGAAELPRNGPFQALSELLAVRGTTPDLYARVRPYLTLLGSGQVNLLAAERPVLLALPGMTEEAVEALLRLRRRGRALADVSGLGRELSPRARQVFDAALPELLGRTTVETREIEAVSEGWVPDGPIRVRAEGLFARSRGAVFFVWSRVE